MHSSTHDYFDHSAGMPGNVAAVAVAIAAALRPAHAVLAQARINRAAEQRAADQAVRDEFDQIIATVWGRQEQPTLLTHRRCVSTGRLLPDPPTV